MKKALATLLALALFAGIAAAGTLTPGLERQMRGMNADDEIKVLVVMKDQVDIHSLDWQLHDSKTALDTRHRIVIEELQKTAASSQRGLLADLSAKATAGVVSGYTPHWIVNGVVVVTTVEVVRELAVRDDVDVIEADLQVELIEPIKSDKIASPDKAIGIAPGIVDIGSRRIWNELGVDGTGAIVGVLDTGVDGTHPALSARWRGNFAPAAECWFDAAGFGDPTPADHHYHGTHVMGTITGQAANDTIGVAPGAQWIASNVINMSTGSAFDNAVIASFEFMADPDGNPLTTDDVPDVVQNSWGVNEGFTGYYDCDSRWWGAIDACEAAGVVVTWSAGNEGPGGTSMRSPADRAATAYNAFSVGSTNHTAPYVVSSFSSRGPSGCGGAYAIKPEIMAPGDNIYSAEPGGTYQYLSGTSMAGPHVAGIVALMRSANPGLDVITVKQVLMDTAIDMGAAGEENTHGHGFIDGYQAVLTVMTGFGTVTGTVTDATSSLPIAGAAVAVSAPGETTRSLTTNALGVYSSMVPQGAWTVDVSAFGYIGDSAGVTVIEDATTTQDFALTPAPSAMLYGYVNDDSANPVSGATVTVLGTPLTPATTDPMGYYSLSMPTGSDYEVLAQAYGMGGHQQTVTAFSADTQLDFVLPELIFENFESGGFAVFPWDHSGDSPWTVDNTVAYEGTSSARSGVITHSQASTLSIDLDVVAAGNLEFYYMVSSENSYDYLRFYVDGAEVASWSGEVPWTLFSHGISAGLHTVAWSYTKDGSVNTGADAAWIDYVVFPAIVPPAYPNVSWTPPALFETLLPGGMATQSIMLSNSGEGTLEYIATAVLNPVPVFTATSPDLGKDDVDPRPGRHPLLGSGGPDAFSYTWIDSDEAFGPTYNWVEINTVGTPQTFSDDNNQSFPMGFTFNYYGVDYTNVNICSNGWASMTSTSTDYSNDPIPSATEPNNLMAVFWDDLNPSSGGQIYTYQDAANNRFIVEWEGVPYYSSSQYQTFQLIINADGTFVYQYHTIDDRQSATIGTENAAGDDGLSVLYNSTYIHNDLAILFSFVPPPAPWMTIAPESGFISPSGNGQIDVTFDATDTPLGTYEGYVLIQTNDPNNTQIIVPTTLIVYDEVPAEAGAISVSNGNGEVALTWIYDLSAIEGFNVYRRIEGESQAVRLNDAPVSSNGGRIDFVDSPAGLAAGTKLFYRYGMVVGGAEISMSPEVVVTFDGSLPTKYSLHANYPNPFNPSTTVKFEIPRAGMTRLAIYDVAGRMVKVLTNEVLPASAHSVVWNGDNDRGQRVASGTYYMRLTSGDYEAVQKMTLMK